MGAEGNSPRPKEDDKGISRRDFLKYMGVGAATVVAGGKLTGCEFGQSPEKSLEEMKNSPTEKMEVVAWGEALSTEDAKKPRTIDELRSQAGWSRDQTNEFIQILSESYPESVAKDGTIQPGFYEVPVKQEG